MITMGNLKAEDTKTYQELVDRANKWGIGATDELSLQEFMDLVYFKGSLDGPHPIDVRRNVSGSNIASHVVNVGPENSRSVKNSESSKSSEREVSIMKLKDYKKDPEMYQKMKDRCAQLGIKADDETEITEILRQKRMPEARLRAAGFSMDSKRMRGGRA